jgi:hypothetical protein
MAETEMCFISASPSPSTHRFVSDGSLLTLTHFSSSSSSSSYIWSKYTHRHHRHVHRAPRRRRRPGAHGPHGRGQQGEAGVSRRVASRVVSFRSKWPASLLMSQGRAVPPLDYRPAAGRCPSRARSDWRTRSRRIPVRCEPCRNLHPRLHLR